MTAKPGVLRLKCVVDGCTTEDHAPYLIPGGHGHREGPACQQHHAEWNAQFHADQLNTAEWLNAEAEHLAAK